MKRLELQKELASSDVHMTKSNLHICIKNQGGYQTQYLNDSLHLQFYSFCDIANLQPFSLKQTHQQEYDPQIKQFLSKGVNTIFLNNNLISKIQNLSCLKQSLKTLNLSHNKIEKIQGLNQLVNLTVLDLSNNQISLIFDGQINKLESLTHLNLGNNKLTTFQSIFGILALKQNIQFLSLLSNQNIQDNPKILVEILSKLQKLKIIYLKDTQFSRKTPSYRKQVITAVLSLTFLDDRPVTDDQRLLASAWKRGGIIQQRQARKTISEGKHEKNAKIMLQIQERNRIVDQKVQKIFKIKTDQEQKQLGELLAKRISQDFELMDQQEQQNLNLKIEDLQKYLQLFKEQCRSLDLDIQLGLKKVELPKMIIENRTSDRVYIYNVSEQQLPLIKQKYYPEQVLPLEAVNYTKQEELRWINQYRPILAHIYKISRGNMDMIEPMFNLQVYQFDLNTGRKLKRFRKEELLDLIHQKLDSDLYDKVSNNRNYNLNSLDSLD